MWASYSASCCEEVRHQWHPTSPTSEQPGPSEWDVGDTGGKRPASEAPSDPEQPKRVKLQDGGVGEPEVAGPNAMLASQAEEGVALFSQHLRHHIDKERKDK